MRRYLVFALLVLMGVSFVMSVSTRPRAAHRVPAAQSRSGSGNGSGNGSGSAASKAKPGSKPTDKARPAKAVKKIARPLRLVCLRWAPCAPAIVANGGVRTAKGSLYAARGLDVRVGARVDIKDIERALGAGGGKADGADIAIVPLSELVAAHERLRALAPRVVLLTGWSHGDVALIARTPAAARAALRPYARGRVTLSGAPGRSATLLSLFTLDLAGVAPERVALVGASTRSAALYARTSLHVSGLPHQRTLLTSADASRLLPYVAVAPRGLVKARARALVRFADGWIAGAKRAAADVPAAARAVAAVDRAEHDASRRSASALIADLGAIAPASLLDNARSFGLSGRPPLTLDWLYRKAHQLWRGAGQLAGQTPARAPVHADIVARLVRERPLDTLAAAHPDADSRSDQPALRFDSGSRRRAIVRHQSRTRSTRALADRLAIVAAIFDGSRVELRHARGRRAARRVIAHACERFEIAGASARLVAGSKIERAAATITVQAHGH